MHDRAEVLQEEAPRLKEGVSPVQATERNAHGAMHGQAFGNVGIANSGGLFTLALMPRYSAVEGTPR